MLVGVAGVEIVRQKKKLYTKLYEYVRSFHWFHWLKDSTPATTQKTPSSTSQPTHQLTTTDWLNYAISNIKSPEEQVREQRINISNAWVQIYQQLQHSNSITDVPPIAKAVHEFDDSQNIERKTIIYTTYQNKIQHLQKHIIRKTSQLKTTDTQKLGELMNKITLLKEKMKRDKEIETMKQLSSTEKGKMLTNGVLRFLQPYL